MAKGKRWLAAVVAISIGAAPGTGWTQVRPVAVEVAPANSSKGFSLTSFAAGSLVGFDAFSFGPTGLGLAAPGLGLSEAAVLSLSPASPAGAFGSLELSSPVRRLGGAASPSAASMQTGAAAAAAALPARLAPPPAGAAPADAGLERWGGGAAAALSSTGASASKALGADPSGLAGSRVLSDLYHGIRSKDAAPETPGTSAEGRAAAGGGLAPVAGAAPQAESPQVARAALPATGTQGDDGPVKPRSVFTTNVLSFFSSFILIQVAVESIGLVIPQLANPLAPYGFLIVGSIAAASYVAYAIGAFVGGPLVKRFGVGGIYRTGLIARTGIWTAVAFLFDPVSQTIPIMALAALFIADILVHSVNRVAEQTLRVAWFKGNKVQNTYFGTIRDFVEYGTVFSTLGAGWLIVVFGFGSVVYAAPVFFAVAALIAFFVRLPGPSASALEKTSFREGFDGLFGSPSLRRYFVGKVMINNFFYTLYYITATAFGVFAAAGVLQKAALVSSALTGVYGIGAIAAAFVMFAVARHISKRTETLEKAAKAAKQEEMLVRGAELSLKFSAAALLGAWAFVNQAYLFTIITWPVYWVTPALLLIGLTAQVALTHLDSMMSDQMPEDKAASIIGAERTLTYSSYAISFFLWGALFQLFGTGAFWLVGAGATAMAYGYLRLAKNLRGGAPPASLKK